MTAALIHFNIFGMTKPGRRPSTPMHYRLELIRRTRAAREKVGLSQEEVAQELSRRAGRPIVADTYRKYEIMDSKKGALLPHDLILYFCDITHTHPYELLDPRIPAVAPVASKKRAA